MNLKSVPESHLIYNTGLKIRTGTVILFFVSYKAQRAASTPPQPTESSASQPPGMSYCRRLWDCIQGPDNDTPATRVHSPLHREEADLYQMNIILTTVLITPLLVIAQPFGQQTPFPPTNLKILSTSKVLLKQLSP